MEAPIVAQADNDSDYGSDFTPDEEEILRALIEDPSRAEPDNPIKDPGLRLQGTENDERPPAARLPPGARQALRSSTELSKISQASRHIQVSFDLGAIVPENIESEASRTEREGSVSIEAPLEPVPEAPDYRSPIERFRTKPKKPLSVTDLISPSWCELQYWYTLTKQHGKKRRTPAMRQGSAVHKTLEDQVHTTVPVEVQTMEDAWGLRIWNMIQGLRTLQETGLTRELEIWGQIDGQLVNGIIDELSYICPDPDLGAAIEESLKPSPKKQPPQLPPDQPTITEYLTRSRGKKLESNGQPIDDFFSRKSPSTPEEPPASAPPPRIYITDIKTRSVPSLPKGASFRPTEMQLMVYHRLLSDLGSNNFDFNLVFERYNLDANKPFTSTLLAQINALNSFPFASTDTDSDDPDDANFNPIQQSPDPFLLTPTSTLTTLTTLLTSTLNSLLTPSTLSPLLTAEYRTPISHPPTLETSDSSLLGRKTFAASSENLDTYLTSTMSWWRGERDAQGVSIEEAYKCGSCDFAESCEWRSKKIGEAVGKMRAKRARSKV